MTAHSRPHARERQVALQVHAEPGCPAFAGGDYLPQALMNVLLNAIGVSGTVGQVDLKVDQQPK